MRNPQWMNWLSNSGSMKKVSLLPYGPAPHIWRNCLNRSKSYKRLHLPPHLYEPIPQLSGGSVSLLKKGDIVGTYHVQPCGFNCVTTEKP